MNERDSIPCRLGGTLHRQVSGSNRCGDCNTRIILAGRFVRAVLLEKVEP